MKYCLKFKDYEERVYNCEFTTPAFIGGADNKESEIRSASFKGLLRYWWRAHKEKRVNNTKNLLKEESDIFGGNLKEINNKNLKSNLGLKVFFENKPKTSVESFKCFEKIKPPFYNGREINVLNYLAYGPYTYVPGNNKEKGTYKFIRAYIQPCQKFKIYFRFPKKYKDEIENSFKLLCLLGGFGAKYRNGFGNFSCSEIIWSESKLDELINETKFIQKVYQSEVCSTWENALSNSAKKYIYSKLNLEKKHYFDLRKFFGSPINDMKYDVKKGKKISFSIVEKRYPKPYFIHTHKIENSKYVSYILFKKHPYFDLNEEKKSIEIYSKFNLNLKNVRGK